METIDRYESEVRSYCRSFPAVFERACGHTLYDRDGESWIDFFAGAGALNYGHNDPGMKQALLDYVAADGIVHGLDMATTAKRRFLERFNEVVLAPRGMDYKIQFPGPTGTNSVESALKLARKVTGRENVISFTNAFHGMTLGSLAITGNSFKRGGAGVPLNHGTCMPFCGYLGQEAETIDYMDAMLRDNGSGVDLPAAIIVETVQAEGGINVASNEWLRGIERLCHDHDMLLIVDDIQAGCGRTGTFFSFEPAGLHPDIVCLSKSLSGYGLPLAVTLIRPELDVWEPGEHNGTFRGNNPAFVTATEALKFWEDPGFEGRVRGKGRRMRKFLERLTDSLDDCDCEVRGRGMLLGIHFEEPSLAPKICRIAFERGLVMETSGPDSTVIKLMPALTIDEDALDAGLDIVAESVRAAVGQTRSKGSQAADQPAA